MAMTATLAQATNALMGAPTTFVLVVSNSGASQVNVNSIQPIITNPGGQPLPSLPCNVGAIVAPGSQPSVAQVGGSQFNVPVASAGSTTFTFQLQFFGQAINGTPSAAAQSFLVGATVQSSDGSVFGPVPFTVNLNSPIFGQPGSPPNLVPIAGQLIFDAPVASPLAL